jgi:hypothetical protein
MFKQICWHALVYLLGGFFLTAAGSKAQGNAGAIEATVKDQSGAVIAGATVQIGNSVSGFSRSAITSVEGTCKFTNVPFNPYHLVVDAAGFASYAQDVDVRSSVPTVAQVTLKVGTVGNSVTVEASGGDLVENDSTFHTDVDRGLFDKLPLESSSSSVSSLVTLSTPGVAADSNGLFHGLGDHASNSFSVDGQPITDQQSKIFSNQIPVDSIQSLEVISGAPPAEFGDKTSLVIKVTTRSGLGVTTPTGSILTDYGSFGTAGTSFNLAYGGQKWGNFISLGGLRSGRFLDPPEFTAIHDQGNEENFFDRFDYNLNAQDALHFNFGYTRSWFQTPNAFDNLHSGVTGPDGNLLGQTDQRSKIGTVNIAPSWTHLFNNATLITLGGFVRRDQFNYYPSANPFADLGPLQSESIAQNRKLTNAGAHSELSYVKGIHNIKTGVLYEQTFLDEAFSLGIVNPTLNSPCIAASGASLPGFTDPSQCVAAGVEPNVTANPLATTPFNPVLSCFDLTRPNPSPQQCRSATSAPFLFHGHTDIKELALYVQDTITKGHWSFNLGIRGDLYNGLATASQAEPRLGAAYNIKGTNTVLRLSYARTLETPFNENLIIANSGCNVAVIAALVPCVPATLSPGTRNEFHAGLQQAFGKYFVVDGEYIWKYTNNAYDFSILGNTPITFPIQWEKSKIPGVAARASLVNFHGFTALVVMSSVAARFFPPQVGGLGVTVGQSGSVFRIDHDERFNETTHLQYQPWQRGPWFGFNWRYDSGLVAGAVPFAVDATTPVDLTVLTADQQMQAGLFCGAQKPTQSAPLTFCAPALYGSTLVRIPAPGTENDDHNPPRIAPRNLFDASIGDDNLFHGDRFKWSLRFTVINLTDKKALYNFLSTFSGTHYVTPRSESVELGFHF